jgi:hypothetical protein
MPRSTFGALVNWMLSYSTISTRLPHEWSPRRSKHDRKAEVLRHASQVSHLRTIQMATDLGPSDPVLIGRATNHHYLGIGRRVFELRLLPTSVNPTSASC